MILNSIATGDPKGKPLVLLHGWGADSSFMLPIAKMFRDRDVYAIDLPGYGLNESFASLAPDFNASVEAILETIPKHSDIIAWSLSSLYAIKAAAIDKGHKIDSLVTICGSPRFPSDPNWPGMSFKIIYKCKILLSPRRVHRILRFFTKLQVVAVDKIYPDYVLLNQMLSSMPDTDYEVLKAGIDIMSYIDMREEFKYLKIPTLNLFGSKDRLVPSTVSSHLRKKNGTFIYILNNSAHVPYITEPILFEKIVRAFLQDPHEALMR